jgi:predicted Zn-dependent peptidase
MIFFVQGDVDFKQVIRLVEKSSARLEENAFTMERKRPQVYVPQSLTLHRDTHQAHVMIGGRAYDAHNEKRTALYLLNNILGGPGMNSRLNVALRERSGLVYQVEANLTSYTDTGVFSIYFGTEHEDVDRCIRLVRKELKRLCDKPLTDTQLRAAKKQIIGQIGVARDNAESTALGMAKTFLHYGKVDDPKELFQRIETLSAKELWEVSNEMFAEDYLSTLIYI